MACKRSIALFLAALQFSYSWSGGAASAAAQVVSQTAVQVPAAQASQVAAVGASSLGIRSLNASGASLSAFSNGMSPSVLPSFSGPLTQTVQNARVSPAGAAANGTVSGITASRVSALGTKAASPEAAKLASSGRSRGIARIRTVSRRVGAALKVPGIYKEAPARRGADSLRARGGFRGERSPFLKEAGGELSKGAAESLFSALTGGGLIRSRGGVASVGAGDQKRFGRIKGRPASWEIKPAAESKGAAKAPSIEKAPVKAEPGLKAGFFETKAFRRGAVGLAAAAAVAMFAFGGAPAAVAGTLGSLMLGVIGVPQIVRNFRQGREATKDLAPASTLIWFAAATLLSVVSVGQGNSLPWIAVNVAGVVESLAVLGQIVRYNKDWKALKIGAGITAASLGLIALIATQSVMPLAAWMNASFWGAMGLLWVLNWPQIRQNFKTFLKEGRAPNGIQPLYPALVTVGSILHLFAALATMDSMWAMNAIIAIVTAGAVLAQIYAPKAANAVIGPLVKASERLGFGKSRPGAGGRSAEAYLPEARRVMSDVFAASDYTAMAGFGAEAQLEEFSRRAAALPGRGLIILEAPTAAGKSTLANRLEEVLGERGRKIKSIEVDRYFKARKDVPIGRDGQPDFDLPESLLLDRVASDIKALLEGKRIELPVHDMESGATRFETGEFFEVGEDEVLVVDSIYASHETILNAIAGHESLNVYLDAPAAIRLARRIARDKVSRGMTAEDNLRRWAGIIANERDYIIPLKAKADLVMNLVEAGELSGLSESYAKLLAEEWERVGRNPEITRLFIDRIRESIEADKSF